MNEAAELERARINSETAKIPWQELQRFFAQGKAIAVGDGLDLVDVAWHFSVDDKEAVQHWLTDGQLAVVSDEIATQWLSDDVLVWAVVVRPWVMVQLATAATDARHGQSDDAPPN